MGGARVPKLTHPQAEFLALPHKFRAFVGGYGSGKTWVGGADLCAFAWEWPRVNSSYFAPTYPQIRDIFYPTIDEVAFDWGLRTRVNHSNKEVHVYSGSRYRNTIICRSMEKPGSIVGFKVGRALVDEIDTMAKQKARDAWRRIIARLRVERAGLLNRVDLTTTPEGFNFAYEQFEKEPSERPELAELYGKVHASTYDNEANLPADYIPSLFATYPEQLVAAYLHGRFVNLRSGSVYPSFDRRLNNTNEIEAPREPLNIGMDFNVGNMSGTVCVERDNLPRQVAELTDILDTPAMIRAIKERYCETGREHPITVFPDASGDSRKTNNASESDLQLLRNAGFAVRARKSNPSVRSRVVSVNAMFCNALDERRLLINVARCPKTVEDLEQQVYDENGQPDKQSGHDHRPDALGYFVHYRFPALKSVRVPAHEKPDNGLVPFTEKWLMYGSEAKEPRHF